MSKYLFLLNVVLILLKFLISICSKENQIIFSGGDDFGYAAEF